jgi:cell wall-associated NlpC family hydrolase
MRGASGFVLCLSLLTTAVILAGCVSSPRFRSANIPESAKKEIAEETAGNNAVVNADSVLPQLGKGGNDAGFDRGELMNAVQGMIGTPYNYSGTGLSGIDCSGFTLRIYSTVMRKQLPHSSVDQYNMCSAVPKGSEKVGDLVFFKTVGNSISHVGIFLGGVYFAHASVSQGVTISSLESDYYKSRFAGTRRLQ